MAAVVIPGPDDRVAWAGAGITGVSDRPYRVSAGADALVGTDGSPGWARRQRVS